LRSHSSKDHKKDLIPGQCEHKCTTSSSLTTHKQIHSQEKPFESKRSYSLKIHKQNHTDETGSQFIEKQLFFPKK